MLKNKKRRSLFKSLILFLFLPFFLFYKKKGASHTLTDFERESGFSGYGVPSKFERLYRWIISNSNFKGNGVSYTPLSRLEGVIVPNGLHFERHHYGIKEINPSDYSINFINKKKIIENVLISELKKMEMITIQTFIECGGNSMNMYNDEPVNTRVDLIHGLISFSEWTGVSLKLFLKKFSENKYLNSSKWLEFESSDKGSYNISIPYDQAFNKGLLALYQNGEAIRPEQGYPLRLIIPGWEGSTHVKWLKNIKLRDTPVYSRNETSKYTDLLPNGKSRQFSFLMQSKSIILKPSPGIKVSKGPINISGIAWSGSAQIKRVQISFDSGKSWNNCMITNKMSSANMKRFNYNYQWNGEEVIIQSRCIDSNDYIQPNRKVFLKKMGKNARYHFNAITSWKIKKDGSIKHVYS